VAPAKRDLDELSHHPESNVKIQLERRENEVEVQHRRRKELIVLKAVIAAPGLLMGCALAFVLVPGLAPESKNWATPTLSAIVAFAVG
jgi:hypothetical protein